MAALNVIVVLLFAVTLDLIADRASGEQINGKMKERMKRQVSVQNEDDLDERLGRLVFESDERISQRVEQVAEQSREAAEENEKKLDALTKMMNEQLNISNTILKGFSMKRSCEEFWGSRQGEYDEIIPTRYGYELLCDTKTDGGGWTVFQRRIDGSVDFYRNWVDYVNGFGDIRGTGYWLGLKHLSYITSQDQWEMRVDLKFNGTDSYAQYSYFKVLDAGSKYKLSVDGYTGTAGESLIRKSNGMAFTTKDRDNDVATYSCARRWRGAWWYGNCHDSNLNGKWGSKGVNGIGVIWRSLTTDYDSASFTQMMIRPVR